MPVCAVCGEESPERARFCLACGAQFGAPSQLHEERKVVTVLFADLVGFTRRSEAMDVEDVRGTLQPYHQLLRRELERFGGTVEKFIGDAVMALFGAPTANEDDPERAVRAALAIQDAVARLRDGNELLDLHVRIGVNTGEALVALGANPQAGEGMASGDVVNTAARLQSAAPVDGVLVGEITYRATSRTIEYRAADAVIAKGKSERVPAWVAKHARPRLGGDVRQMPSTPLVGREQEVRLLWEAFERARTERTPQLVTLIGVPGIGKSRLVWELFRRVGDDPDSTAWRQGRSLPYGDGVVFWALSEMVKAQAGVLDSDSAEVAGEKLHDAVRGLIPDDRSRGWIEGHVRPLLGLGVGAEPTGDRAEAFAAWRQLIEAIAERRPTILVFDDLHWADDALLDFVDHLVEWASGVPLLVVGTARPELFERRKAFGAGTSSAVRISLSALSEDETTRLLSALLEDAVLPAETQAALLGRAEGNPLYAEEYVRMLIDRRVLVRDGRHWRLEPGASVPLPESVQGITAARLDALQRDEKSVLQAAAVVGKAAWLSAVEAVAGVSRWQAEQALHRLERKEFLRRERRSSVKDETEYAFRHILIRDVAYSQIPRAERARKHEQAAEWIESLAERDDGSELLTHQLAYHYLAALEARRTAGQPPDWLVERTRVAVRFAGERALSLHAYASAIRHFTDALGMWPDDDPERSLLLFGLGKAWFYAQPSFPTALTEAKDALLSSGDSERAAEAGFMLSVSFEEAGDPVEARQHIEHAARVLETAPDSSAKARVLCHLGCLLLLNDRDYPRGVALNRQAAGMSQVLGLPEIGANAAMWVGIGRILQGDPDGIDDLWQSVDLASQTQSADALPPYANVSEWLFSMGDLAGAHRLADEALNRANHLGKGAWGRSIGALHLQHLYCTGRWADARTEADMLLSSTSEEPASTSDIQVRVVRGLLRRATADDESRSSEDFRAAADLARHVGRPELMILALPYHATSLVHGGRTEDARAVMREFLHVWRGEPWNQWALAEAAYVASLLDLEREFLEVGGRSRVPTPWLDAATAIVRGDLQHAATVFADIGSLPDEAFIRMHAGRQLIQLGFPDRGAAELEKALGFWKHVDAWAYAREAEALLTQAAPA